MGVAYLVLPSCPIDPLGGQLVRERGWGAYLVLPLQPILLLAGWLVGGGVRVAYLVLPSCPVHLLGGQLVGERGQGWGRCIPRAPGPALHSPSHLFLFALPRHPVFSTLSPFIVYV